jgi:hypothetical protein
MSTVALNIYTSAYPTISNNIEIRVYKQSDPLAIVVSDNHPAPHGDDTWSFPGLERTNYLFRIFEMIGSSIIQELGNKMDVVPGAAQEVNFKATEQITADATTGFTSGVNTATFDGTSGTQDWRGWEVSTMDRMGTGPMKKGIDYSWNKVTGEFLLLNSGDVFAPDEWFNVDFQPQRITVTASVPVNVPLFLTPKKITANYTVSAGSDMGGLLIVDPAGNYLEITLPDIATVVAGKLLTIEMRRAAVNKTCKIKTQPSQIIDWLAGSRNDLYMCPQESIGIYKWIDPSGPTSMWRVFNPYGNFLKVGEQIYDDNSAANVFNKILMTGADGDVLQLARFYNDYVLQLPAPQVCNYDDWATGNNKYKFSLANSAVGANAGKFKIPDRRNIFFRNTDGTRLPAEWQDLTIGQHKHNNGVVDDKPAGNNENIFVYGQTNADLPGAAKGNVGNGPGFVLFQGFTSTVGGAENRPANIATRIYLLV